jgi:hypothetical protein
MRNGSRNDYSKKQSLTSMSLERRLAAYAAASVGVGLAIASEANAIVVSSSTVQNVGINGFASIDFNSDGQTDFQIDHDRVDLTPQGGPVVDYLQIDKNDINGEDNPLAFDPQPNIDLTATPFQDGATPRNEAAQAAYLVALKPGPDSPNPTQFQYPSALLAGADIGPNQFFDFQEGDNVFGSGRWGRLNRLIDEDHTQIDMTLGGRTADGVVVPTNTPQFLGVQGQTRYLGVRMDLNNAASGNAATDFTYGWIGIKVTNEADATAQVVGWGYDTTPGATIKAGQTAAVAGDYDGNGKVDAADYVIWRNGGPLQNEVVTIGTVTPEDYTAWRAAFGNPSGSGAGSAVPEPGSALLSLLGGLAMLGAFILRRLRRR